MTSIPKPAAPAESFTATYDAWNRLVRLEEEGGSGLETVAEHRYDARGYRVVTKRYENGSPAETRHHYYSSAWQVLEERVGASPETAGAERQFVWGVRYIDDLVLRDRASNGALDERLYALQDGNWNVVAIADEDGDVQERYGYAAYGWPVILTAAFQGRAASEFDWETLYGGYRWDSVAQAFHVRHRVLLAHLGVWSRRDPLANDVVGFVDAPSSGSIDMDGGHGSLPPGIRRLLSELPFAFSLWDSNLT